MYKAFPCSDYYGDSVAMPNIQGTCIPIANFYWRFGLDNPHLDIQ